MDELEEAAALEPWWIQAVRWSCDGCPEELQGCTLVAGLNFELHVLIFDFFGLQVMIFLNFIFMDFTIPTIS